MKEKITLDEGKYEVVFVGSRLKALRYGEEWRDLTGDKLFLCMFQRICELEDKLKKRKAKKHQFKQSEDCNCGETGCPICDNVFKICKICNLYEGSLTTDCSGVRISMDVGEQVFMGKLDYREDEGWVNKQNPTNQNFQERRK